MRERLTQDVARVVRGGRTGGGVMRLPHHDVEDGLDIILHVAGAGYADILAGCSVGHTNVSRKLVVADHTDRGHVN